MTHISSSQSDRTIGIVLFISAVLTIVVMAHHPSGMHGGSLVYWVHGAMLLLLSSLFLGFSYFSLRRGLSRPVILAALVAYLLNYVAHIIAGTMNGFIVPSLAGYGDSIPVAIYQFSWETNQAFARLGTVATAVAFGFWGIDLVRRETGFTRVVGVIGLVCGLLPLALLVHDSTMTVHNAFIIYSLNAVFALLVALTLIRRKLP